MLSCSSTTYWLTTYYWTLTTSFNLSKLLSRFSSQQNETLNTNKTNCSGVLICHTRQKFTIVMQQ